MGKKGVLGSNCGEREFLVQTVGKGVLGSNCVKKEFLVQNMIPSPTVTSTVGCKVVNGRDRVRSIDTKIG